VKPKPDLPSFPPPGSCFFSLHLPSPRSCVRRSVSLRILRSPRDGPGDFYWPFCLLFFQTVRIEHQRFFIEKVPVPPVFYKQRPPFEISFLPLFHRESPTLVFSSPSLDFLRLPTPSPTNKWWCWNHFFFWSYMEMVLFQSKGDPFSSLFSLLVRRSLAKSFFFGAFDVFLGFPSFFHLLIRIGNLKRSRAGQIAKDSCLASLDGQMRPSFSSSEPWQFADGSFFPPLPICELFFCWRHFTPGLRLQVHLCSKWLLDKIFFVNPPQLSAFWLV